MANSKKALLWDWVMYHDLCTLHGKRAPPVLPPLTYDMWRAIKAAQEGR